MSKGFRTKIPAKTADEFEQEIEYRELLLEGFHKSEVARIEVIAKLQTTLGYSYDMACRLLYTRLPPDFEPESETDRRKRWSRELVLETQLLRRRRVK